MKAKNLLAMALVLLSAAVSAAEVNLIRNPDFEASGKNWIFSKGTSFENKIAAVPLNVQRKNKKDSYGSIYQLLPVKPGKYRFFGYYQGDINNLFIVVRIYLADRKKADIIQKWLGKADFVKADDLPGWYCFSYQTVIPDNASRVSVHIEPWGTNGNIMRLTRVKLAEETK